MTTNKPHIEAYLVTRIKGRGYGKPRRILDAEVYDPTSDSFFAAGAKENNTVEPLVSLSDYEALQAECEKLRKDAERYQWLRGNGSFAPSAFGGWALACGSSRYSSIELDASVDAAMQLKMK